MVLRVDNLSKIYSRGSPFKAVDEISFQLKEGEILGLLGPNGSGKTTTIQMLLGTLTPTSGDIRYFGKSFYAHRSDVLKQVAYASTYTSLPYILTVEENLKIIGRLYGQSNILKKAYPLLERFGIYDKRHKAVSSLSAGQVTRLMIVKAFVTDPKIVLLDEPTASLDPDVAHDVCEFLLEERDKTQLSLLFTSHKMEEVSELCDRVVFLKKGKIIADDLPANLARSVSSCTLRLVIVDGLKRALALAENYQYRTTVEHRVVEFELDEQFIPNFLREIMEEGVVYSGIQIIEPSLEDYFFQIAKRNQ
jgi:ABC-2 type transport system ATP-binding protein